MLSCCVVDCVTLRDPGGSASTRCPTAGWCWRRVAGCFCGSACWLAEGRAGGELGTGASLCPLLAVECIVSCVLVWDAQPGEGSQHHVPLCYFRNSYLASSSACLKELPQVGFFCLACFILTSLSTVSSLFWATWKSRRFA